MIPITVGVDLGQSRDPTAIIVTRAYRSHLDEPSFAPGGPLPDAAKEPEDQFRPELHHQIIHIERIPLGTAYPEVVRQVSEAADWAAQYGRPVVVMDSTGVGRPVVDLFRRDSRHALRAVTFTGGATATKVDAYSWRVPKRELIGSLEVVMQTSRLFALPGQRLAKDLFDELASFQFKMTDSGNDTYDAASGTHDDLVCALALAVWWEERNANGQGSGFLEAWRRMAVNAQRGLA